MLKNLLCVYLVYAHHLCVNLRKLILVCIERKMFLPFCFYKSACYKTFTPEKMWTSKCNSLYKVIMFRSACSTAVKLFPSIDTHEFVIAKHSASSSLADRRYCFFFLTSIKRLNLKIVLLQTNVFFKLDIWSMFDLS